MSEDGVPEHEGGKGRFIQRVCAGCVTARSKQAESASGGRTQQMKTVIGKQLSSVALRTDSSIPHVTFLCMHRPAGELSRGDDPFDRGLFRQNLVS